MKRSISKKVLTGGFKLPSPASSGNLSPNQPPPIASSALDVDPPPKLVIPDRPLPSPHGPSYLDRSPRQSGDNNDDTLSPENTTERPVSARGAGKPLEQIENRTRSLSSGSEGQPGPTRIGTDVLGVSQPNRPPPPPPSSEEDDEEEEPLPVPPRGHLGTTIRVVGTVASSPEEADSSAPSRVSQGWTASPTATGMTRASHRFLQHSRSSLMAGGQSVSHRTKLVREVISSEESYVRSLDTLVHHFLIPIREHSDKRASRELRGIFGNVEQILQLNNDLLQRLQERGRTWTDNALIGDIFITIAPFLKLYATYGTNYESAIHLYEQQMKENIAFREAVETKNLEAGDTVALNHLLIMPIQRIPRYNMLLTDIIKHTADDHPDYQNLQTALAATKKVAMHLNESVRASETERNMIELAERMDLVFLLEPHRRLIREGAFRIVVKKKEKHNLHHLILFNDVLVCISRSKIRKAEEFTTPQQNWPLNLVWVNDTEQDRLRVVGPTHEFLVCFEQPEEMAQWHQAIQASIDNFLMQQKETVVPDGSTRFGSFEFPGGAFYDGCWRGGKKHGFGTFRFHHNVYQGHFNADVMSGSGKISYVSGEMYTGEWANGLPNGEGTFGAPNGDLYDGQWKDGRRQGTGKFVYSNGDVYEGQWHQDLAHGTGKLVSSSGQRYEGEWQRGQRSGTGVVDQGNGKQYDGEWAQDKPHGHGTMVEMDGSYYEGHFAHGSFDGTGVMVYKDGRKYSGQWRAGKPNGSGKYTTAIGTIFSYDGEWLNGQLHGKGTVVYANKDKYTGFLRENRLHGAGVYEHGNTVLEGKWNTGQLEGKVVVRIIDCDEVLTGSVSGSVISFNDTFAPMMLIPPITHYMNVDL